MVHTTHTAVEYDSRQDRAFFGHPKGLSTLFFVEFWERFSFYGMKAILLFYLTAEISKGGMGIATARGEQIVALYGAVVYFLPVIGGYIADRLIGPGKTTFYGGIIIMAGHISMAVPGAATTWLGICLVALGTGLLKPNISTIVGNLYHVEDRRRDAGFTVFYMAINAGAFISPFITGWLGDNVSYHAGFVVAAIGMGFALVWYVMGQKDLHGVQNVVPNPLEPAERTKTMVYAAGALLGLVLLYYIFAAVGGHSGFSLQALVDVVTFVCIIVPLYYFWMMFRSAKCSSAEKSHVLAYIPLWVGAVLFWSIFEQAAIKMATFAKDNTENNIFGWQLPAAFFQSVNPLAIIVLATPIAILWTKRLGKFPSLPAKFAMAVAIIGLSALMMAWGFANFDGAHRAPVIFLVMVFVVQTIGELFLSPVGLSATTLLAPRAFAAQMMALWFLTSSVGQVLSAQLIGRMEHMSNSQYYMVNAVITLAVAGVLFLLVPWTRRKMADVEEMQNS